MWKLPSCLIAVSILLQDEVCDHLIEKFSLLPLYSEANPIISFLVHRGANMTGQVLKIVVSVQSVLYVIHTVLFYVLLYILAECLPLGWVPVYSW